MAGKVRRGRGPGFSLFRVAWEALVPRLTEQPFLLTVSHGDVEKDRDCHSGLGRVCLGLR